jgi:hypothetical protein
VEEVAGILVRDTLPQRSYFCGDPERSEKFSDVTNFFDEGACMRMLCFCWGKEMIVFLERGAAARRVGDDGVKIFAKKNREILTATVIQ